VQAPAIVTATQNPNLFGVNMAAPVA